VGGGFAGNGLDKRAYCERLLMSFWVDGAEPLVSTTARVYCMIKHVFVTLGMHKCKIIIRRWSFVFWTARDDTNFSLSSSGNAV
jgi:hypothetical protein